MTQSEKPIFGKITSLKEAQTTKEELVEGYCIPLDGEDFRVYVARKHAGQLPGYYLNVTYHWGDDIGISLDNAQLYPQTNTIFNKYRRGEWVNSPKSLAGKSIAFGSEEKDKEAAIALMKQIVAEYL